MNEKNLVSIIIPVYNAEAYIEACVQSVVEQTYDNFELLLIDDGSSDDSPAICDRLAASDSRIKVHHQDNRGVSVARNAGKKYSEGQYLLFVDADDTMQPDMLQRMVKRIETAQAQIAVCGINIVSEAGQVLFSRSVDEKEYSAEEALRSFLLGQVFENGVWNKLFRKDLIENVDFVAGRRMNEDIFFIYEAFCNVEKVATCGAVGYNYYERKGSASHSTFSDRWFDNSYFAHKIYELTIDRFPQLEQAAKSYLLRSQYHLLRLMYSSGVEEQYKEEYQEIRNVLKTYKINDIRDTIKRSTYLGIFLEKNCYPLWKLYQKKK